MEGGLIVYTTKPPLCTLLVVTEIAATQRISNKGFRRKLYKIVRSIGTTVAILKF